VRTSPLVLALVLLAVLAACSDEPGRPVASPKALPSAVESPSPLPSPSPTPSVSPSPSPSTSPSPSPSPSPSAAVAARLGYLTGDGIDLPREVIEFGAPMEKAIRSLRAVWGAPTKDTGVIEAGSSPYGVCPGTDLRGLEFGRGALLVLFGNVDGPELTMYNWSLNDTGTPGKVARARALVGDTATFAFGIDTTVKQAREGTATGTFTVQPPNDPFPASFTLRDQSAGFFGSLTGTTPASRMTFVQAGRACGE
jgi:hypothetical protein